MVKPAFVFDGRNVLDHHALRRLGFEVHGVGKGAELKVVSTIGQTNLVRAFLSLSLTNPAALCFFFATPATPHQRYKAKSVPNKKEKNLKPRSL